MRKIDAVITWVDGDDPKHIAKRNTYGDSKIASREDVGGITRFRSVGEIFYCVASLNRFAPWLNKIYIVTDDQDPKIDERIKELFGEGHIPMEIVDHKRIFEGYEEYLPTFNSISIESMTWRIPGLEEHYIEFNDDLILAAPTTPEDFFTEDGRVVCYGKKYSMLYTTLSHLLRRHRDGSRKVSFRQTMMNAARRLGIRRKYIKIYHTPKALRRSIYERYFEEHPHHLTQNIKYRFREPSQYNVEELQYLLLKRAGMLELRRASDLLYLKPKKDDEYIAEKLAEFDTRANHKFGCFNSIDQLSDEARSMTIEWIKRRICLEE